MHLTIALDQGGRLRAVLLALLGLGLVPAGPALAHGTLDRARETGKLTMGYLADAPPFSFTDASGQPAGYAIALCGKVAAALKSELKLPTMSVDYAAVPLDERFRALEQGKIDILCGAEPTLNRRALLDFSIPVLVSGTGVVIRTDAPARLRDILSGREPAKYPIWRATQGQAPERRVAAVIGGTTVEKALLDRLRVSRMVVEVVAVRSNAAGVQMVLDRRADAFFNDRALLLDAKRRSPSSDKLIVLDRLFKRAQVALAVPRGDDDFRLVVDRTLSQLMRSDEIAEIYASYFGAPDRAMLDFFRLVALPD
jgi:polar amino acid transport system substrate-binding protein